MTGSNPAVYTSDDQTIFEEEQKIENQIRERAHAIFESRGGRDGGHLDDWLTAEHELVWIPVLEVSEKGDALLIQIAAPGFEPDDFKVEVTPTALLVEANVDHTHDGEHGIVHVCEFRSGRMFRALRLPRQIEPGTVKADYRNGMLRLTATIAVEEELKTAQATTT